MPPLAGHRTQTWYASRGINGWDTVLADSCCLECYQCCVWSIPIIQGRQADNEWQFMPIFTCNYSAQSDDTSENNLIQSATFDRALSITNDHKLKMSTSVTPTPKKNRVASLRNPNLLPRYPTSEVLGVWYVQLFDAFVEDLREIIQTNAKHVIWFSNIMFYIKEFYGNIKRIGKIVTMWLHQTCRQKHTQIWRNSEAVEETHKVFHETHWELKKPILENWSSPYHWDSLSPFMAF